jgi:hypothetical protein
MKKVMTTGALLATLVFGVSALTAVSASAAEWLCSDKAVVKAEECLVKSVNLEVLALRDMSAASEIECPVGSVTDEGWVGPGAADKTTKVNFLEEGKKCTAPAIAADLAGGEVRNSCEVVEKVQAEGLPWNTMLETINAEKWDTIFAGGEGNPAYQVTCKVAGMAGVKDLCEEATAHPILAAADNLAADAEAPKLPLVDILFLANTFEPNENEWGTCTIGGLKTALVVGEILLEAFVGGVAVGLAAD